MPPSAVPADQAAPWQSTAIGQEHSREGVVDAKLVESSIEGTQVKTKDSNLPELTVAARQLRIVVHHVHDKAGWEHGIDLLGEPVLGVNFVYHLAEFLDQLGTAKQPPVFKCFSVEYRTTRTSFFGGCNFLHISIPRLALSQPFTL